MAIVLNKDNISFEFPEVHEDAKFSLNFQRTLRIPDDSKTYSLPPGMGPFPLRHVEDFKDRVPAKWLERKGLMLPMYQSEALWIDFDGHRGVNRTSSYPFAVKIAAGKRCALTGKAWWPKPRSGSGEDQDYLVIPEQPWLDGFVVEKGKVRQFVAVPLGMGLTVEAQLDGKEEFGGIQIQVYPMKAEVYERRFPKQPHYEEKTSGMLCCNIMENAAGGCASSMDMGLGAGGTMKQEVYEDRYGLDDWDLNATSRVYVHLANSLAWKAITKHDPPYPPQTAADYTRAGLPWFDYYADDLKALAGTGLLSSVKSVLQLGFQKGLTGVLPENESVDVPSDKVVTLKEKRPGEVTNGNW